MRRVSRALRWLFTALGGLVLGSVLAAVRRRPESPAVERVETGPGEA
jgi:hypothetical protein